MAVINIVINLAKDALGSVESCAVLTLDIKKTFNSTNLNRIKGSTTNIGSPTYFADLVESYLSKGDYLVW